MSDQPSISVYDRRRLALAAMCHEKTAVRAYQGLPVRPLCWERITRAARELGLPLPPATAGARGA